MCTNKAGYEKSLIPLSTRGRGERGGGEGGVKFFTIFGWAEGLPNDCAKHGE